MNRDPRRYYETLGVSPDASAEEIKSARAKLLRAHHPDVNPNDATANERTVQVNLAYEVLGDLDKRKQYDPAYVARQPTPPPQPPPRTTPPPNHSRSASGPTPPPKQEQPKKEEPKKEEPKPDPEAEARKARFAKGAEEHKKKRAAKVAAHRLKYGKP